MENKLTHGGEEHHHPLNRSSQGYTSKNEGEKKCGCND